MVTSTVQVNGEEVPAEAAGKHIINITINQESWLSSLVQAWRQQRAKREEAAPQATRQPSASAVSVTKSHCRGEQKVLGEAQILLGIVCIGLGVVIQYEECFNEKIYAGASFWMGGLFVLSGAWSVVSGRRGGYWIHLATVFNLASVVAGCVALAHGIARIPNLDATYYVRQDLCARRPYQPVSRSRWENWEENDCKRTLWSLMRVAFALRILLLVFSAVALGIALFSFGHGLLVLSRRLKAGRVPYVTVGDPAVPPSYEDRARGENIA